MDRKSEPKKIVRAGSVLLLGLFLCVLLSDAWAQREGNREGRDILVIGTGLVREENIAAARTAAVGEALNKGFEQYLMRTLGEQGAIHHFSRLVRDMISTEKREIESFTILLEERFDLHYKVLVRMRINEKMMEERFREHGIVPFTEPPLNVLFLVSLSEQPENRVSQWWAAPEDLMPLSSVELVLHRIFEGFGFLPVNRLTKSLEGKYGPEMTAPDLSSEEAFQWGELFSVPVVVLGRCEIIDQREVHVSLMALGVESKIIIERNSQSQIAADGGDGLRRALEGAIGGIAKSMCPSIRKAIDSGENKTSGIEILIRGLRSFRDLKSVKEALEREIVGVKSIRQTRVAGDSVGFLVDFSGTKDEFLYQIEGHDRFPFWRETDFVEDETIIFRMR